MSKESFKVGPELSGGQIIFEDRSMLESLKRASQLSHTRLEHYMCRDHIKMVNDNLEEISEELVEEGILSSPYWFVPGSRMD